MTFTKDQPRDGDTILHCGHLDREVQLQRPMRWFKFDGRVPFIRSDGVLGASEWFAACGPCFIEHGDELLDGGKIESFVRGDSRWVGDEPAIEESEPS